MLPAQGMHIEHYRRIFTETDQVWSKLCHRQPAINQAVPGFVNEGMIANTIRELGLEDDPEGAVKRTLLVLHQALGDQVTVKLFKMQMIETMIAVMRLIHKTDESKLVNTDIQTVVLCAAIQHLCLECGGDKPLNMMFHLLNQIPLIHNTHEILVHQVTQAIEGHKRVLH